MGRIARDDCVVRGDGQEICELRGGGELVEEADGFGEVAAAPACLAQLPARLGWISQRLVINSNSPVQHRA